MEITFFWTDPESKELYMFAQADLLAAPRQEETIELFLEDRLDEEGRYRPGRYVVERVIHSIHNTLSIGPEPKPFKHDPEWYPNWIFIDLQPVDDQAKEDIEYVKKAQGLRDAQRKWEDRKLRARWEEYLRRQSKNHV